MVTVQCADSSEYRLAIPNIRTMPKHDLELCRRLRHCGRYLNYERANTMRSCRLMHFAASGQSFASILLESHSIFLPVLSATQPSSMISVSGAATSNRE